MTKLIVVSTMISDPAVARKDEIEGDCTVLGRRNGGNRQFTFSFLRCQQRSQFGGNLNFPKQNHVS